MIILISITQLINQQQYLLYLVLKNFNIRDSNLKLYE